MTEDMIAVCWYLTGRRTGELDSHHWSLLDRDGYVVIGDDEDARRRWAEMVEGAVSLFRRQWMGRFDSVRDGR